MKKLLIILLTIVFLQNQAFGLGFAVFTPKFSGVLNPEIEGLNRDITNSRTITKDEITGALDGSVTVDNRLLLGFLMKREVKDKEGNISTINGYQSIAGDFANFGGNLAKATLGAVGTVIATGKTIYDVAANDKIGIGETAEQWKANQKTFVNQNNYDRKTINSLSEGKQY